LSDDDARRAGLFHRDEFFLSRNFLGAAASSPAMDTMRALKSRLATALISGSVAIALNTVALKAADLVPLATAKGGLLRLVSSWFAGSLGEMGVASAWSRAGAPAPGSPLFQTGFHLCVGMMMALFYAYVAEPALPGGDIRKGAICTVAVWLLNAIVVLPATGEGFAGRAHLTLAGIVWFAVAHSLFFMVLAVLYGVGKRRSGL
jgi:hypothetical protein